MKTHLSTLTLCLTLSGCGTLKDTSPALELTYIHDCHPLGGSGLQVAVEQANHALAQSRCRDQFEPYWSSLLDEGERQPDVSNKAKLAAFLSNQRETGVVSRDQARELYSRYFDIRFFSLPDIHNTCSYGERGDAISAELAEELRQKRRGLLKIADEKSAYEETLDLYGNVKQILLATRTACEAG